ncbi:MAG TPA: permease prefix domain 1-containing protein [Mycobacteriales bacterium]
MARDDLTTTIAAGAEADRLIEAYLAELGRAGRLTPDMADEVADGLCETVEGYRRLGLAPAEAVRAAVAEFGCADTVATAFRAETSRAASHRLGRRLMVSGPLVGVLWLSALLASAAPPLHRQLPGLWALLPLVGVAVVVGAPAAAIAVAASRPWRRFALPARLAAPAVAVSSAAATTGDLTLLAIIAAHVLLHGHVVWPLVLLASTASGVRAILAGRVVARAVTTPSSR